MQPHQYHSFFMPILLKLYQKGKKDEFIDVTDCFPGSAEQNEVVFKNLNESELARVKKEARVLLTSRQLKPQKISGMILPLGIEYVEYVIAEHMKEKKQRPQIGFKTGK